jgi:diguanylate cyclase (GGDEF)-like protein
MAAARPVAEPGDLPELRTLLIEDSAGDAALMKRMIARSSPVRIKVEVCGTLADGLARVNQGELDLIVLDLTLPDSAGLATVSHVHAAAPSVPVVVLSAHDDEALALEAVRLGAQDYLVKGQVTSAGLGRAVRYAVERQRLLASVRDQSLVDELTGLYNRRGLLALAETHLPAARRAGRKVLLVYADLDGLKRINDRLGHHQGDVAITKTAEILRSTFRRSDVIARMGGDEFVVLAIGAAEDTEATLLLRLRAHVDAFNATSMLPFRISLSAGIVGFVGDQAPALEEMLARADQLLYEKKRARAAAAT